MSTPSVPPAPPTKGVFRSLDGGAPLTLPFNPTSFRLGRSVEWSEQSASSQAYSTLQFSSGKTDTLAMTLLLDTTESAASVMPMAQQIYGWTVPAAVSTGTVRPPVLVFQWGLFTFQGVVSRVDLDFTVFDATGNPRRAMVSLEMMGHAFSRGTSPAQFFAQPPAGAGAPKAGG